MYIFLDFDGTLVDIKPRHYYVYEQCTLMFGGQPLGIGEYWDMKRRDAKWAEILPLSGLSSSREDEYLKEFISLIETPEVLKKDQLFEGSERILNRLSLSHTLVLISLRRSHNNLMRQVSELGIKDYFSQIHSGHSDTKQGVLLKKAEVIRQVEGYSNGVIIGDTEADVAAGQQLKIPTIAVTTGIRNRQFLEKLAPDHIVNSLNEAVGVLTETN